ncbi:MAG TPA: hypothetical protein PK156_49285 [Polyangium sp.]|nr:hypothetical protein [Polyangium sp.]
MEPQIAIEQLRVIGSEFAVDPDGLPLRLPPIFRAPDGTYYTGQTDDALGGAMLLGEIDEQFVEAQFASGEMTRFSASFPAREGHVLLQVAPNALPEYLPLKKLSQRLHELSEAKLLEASDAWKNGNRDEAISHAWYAMRAESDDPFALQVVMALLRGSIPEKHMAQLAGDLARFDRSNVDKRLDEARQIPALKPLIALVASNAEPKPGLKRAWRPPGNPCPDFFSSVRSCFRALAVAVPG